MMGELDWMFYFGQLEGGVEEKGKVATSRFTTRRTGSAEVPIALVKRDAESFSHPP
jgi:hypothetical protein